jgi:tetratricopeptide (TPR) repeat protein
MNAAIESLRAACRRCLNDEDERLRWLGRSLDAFLMHRCRSVDRRSIRLAYYAFERAVALDPEFAEAHAALAMTYALDFMGTNTWHDWVRSPGRARAQAEVLARKAASLNARLGAPDLALARIALTEWRYDDALEYTRSAVHMEPGDPEAHATLALVLTATGRHDEAKRAIEEALRRDPKAAPSTQATLGMIQFALGDHEGAALSLEQAIKRMPVGSSWLFDVFDFAAAAYTGNEAAMKQHRADLFLGKEPCGRALDPLLSR